MILTILLILIVLSFFGGNWGSPNYGPASWSPMGILLLILIVMFLTGRLH